MCQKDSSNHVRHKKHKRMNVQVANMLYIDNPAGAGLSYSLNASDYNTTDSQERIDLEQTVRQWFQTYPYFQTHDVFYTGESHTHMVDVHRTTNNFLNLFLHAEHQPVLEKG